MRPGVDVDCSSDGGSPDVRGRFLSSICVSGSRRLEGVEYSNSMGAAWSAAVSWLADHSIGRHCHNSMPVSFIWLLVQALGCVCVVGGGEGGAGGKREVGGTSSRPVFGRFFSDFFHELAPGCYVLIVLAWIGRKTSG